MVKNSTGVEDHRSWFASDQIVALSKPAELAIEVPYRSGLGKEATEIAISGC